MPELPARKPVAYVAGPYRDPRGAYYIRQNIRAAEEVALELWRLGIPAICPHLNTALLDGAARDEVWLEGDIELMRRCDVVVMTPEWERSAGARREKEIAEAVGIPVVYARRARFGIALPTGALNYALGMEISR